MSNFTLAEYEFLKNFRSLLGLKPMIVRQILGTLGELVESTPQNQVSG